MRHIGLSAFGLVASLALVGSASATDLPPRMPIKAPPPPPVHVIYNWSGFYLGVSFGGSFGKQDVSAQPVGSSTTVGSGSVDVNGAVVGDTIGFNMQTGRFVYGIEGDFQGSWENGDDSFTTSATPTTTFTTTARLRYFGTVRGRLGYAYERWLPYVTGGWAFGRGRVEVSTNALRAANFSFTQDTNYSGWTVGAGVEWAFLGNWSAKLEYLYIDLGSGDRRSGSTQFDYSVDNLTDNLVRVGVNYRF